MAKFPPHPQRRGAVITGASSGIGLATAEALALAGHPVVLGARRIDELEIAAARIRKNGGEAHAVFLDLADPATIETFCSTARDALGEIEIIVANAARNQVGSVLDTEPEEFEAAMSVNVAGTHRVIRSLLPEMVERKRGDVVFVTSDVVVNPRPSMVAYVASKWGLEGYARALQMELEGTGIRATVVRPGPTLTGMGMDWDADATNAALDLWRKWGLSRHDNYMRPAGVAEAVMAVVEMARGTHITTLEIHPEAPLHEVGE
ncbi:MAG: SDR family oxidoreductase [Actinomycetes bacterium]|jgi:NADP-dependent 3-hydroxy acid dehydrogenase YdfG